MKSQSNYRITLNYTTQSSAKIHQSINEIYTYSKTRKNVQEMRKNE